MKKVRDWSKYNESLINRGSIAFWFSDEVLKQWRRQKSSARRGRPFLYSDVAIETLLLVREVFRLTYRSVEGFGRDVFPLLGVQNLSVPDYTLLCKRSKTLNVGVKVAGKHGPLNILVDSTGLKVYGEGEWKVRKHGCSKRRTWRKIHIAMDSNSQQVLAVATTLNSYDDASSVPLLLEQIPDAYKLLSLCADGAFDKQKIHELLVRLGIIPVIPPNKKARFSFENEWGDIGRYRDVAIAMIRAEGLDAWKKQVNYHRRSLVETTIYRIKQLFGDSLKNRNLTNQKVEVMMKINVLNRWTFLQMESAR